MNISMNQLATSVRESLKTLNVDNFKEDGEKAPSIQSNYVDSIELSYRAIELSAGANTETDFKEGLDTNQGQEEAPGANQQQEPAFTKAVSLNVLA